VYLFEACKLDFTVLYDIFYTVVHAVFCVIPRRPMAIEAPCRSAFASRHGAEIINAARHVGCARPFGVRLPAPIILCGFAACLSVSKACKSGNATCVHSQSKYPSVSRRYRRRPRRRQHNAGNTDDGDDAVCFIGGITLLLVFDGTKMTWNIQLSSPQSSDR